MTGNERSNGSDEVPFSEQVGLVLRAHRRKHGLTQRAFAEEHGIPQTTVARLERSAATRPLDTILRLLAATGHTLGVVDAEGGLVTDWDVTDRHARDRSGRRFPANREVREVKRGGLPPMWWMLHEEFGTGECEPRPRWTAEGFLIPAGAPLDWTPGPRRPGEDRGSAGELGDVVQGRQTDPPHDSS